MAGKSIVNVSSVVKLSAFKMIFDLLSYLIAGTVKNKHDSYIDNWLILYPPPANVLSVSILLFIPSSGLPVSPPINLTAVTYTLYIVYGIKLVRMYVSSKLVSLTTRTVWL